MGEREVETPSLALGMFESHQRLFLEQINAWINRKLVSGESAKIYSALSRVACSRLRDSWARGIKKARTRRKKTGGTRGEGEAPHSFSFFSRPAPIFARPTLPASSPLSESLEQAMSKENSTIPITNILHFFSLSIWFVDLIKMSERLRN